MNNTIIIMPYFGRIPDYFGTYLKSVEGKHFDVLWISDLEVPRHPENFKVVKMSFDEVKRRMAERLGTEVVINGGRRLCDFRPMYGKVFEDLIVDYDYWGWGDCDLVYGNKFNEFLERAVEAGEYDAISLHKDYMSGPTCFYRNTPQMRELYLKTNNWREVCKFAGSVILNYDECGGLYHRQLASGEMTMEDCAKIRDSFPAAVWREPGLRIYRQEEINEESLAGGEVVTMDSNGRLSLDEREIAVFHYIRAKNPRYFVLPPVPYERVGSYRISKTGFYHTECGWRFRGAIGVIRRLKALSAAVKDHGCAYARRLFK